MAILYSGRCNDCAVTVKIEITPPFVRAFVRVRRHLASRQSRARRLADLARKVDFAMPEGE